MTGRAGCGDLMGKRLWFGVATNEEAADLGFATSHPIADTGLSRGARWEKVAIPVSSAISEHRRARWWRWVTAPGGRQ